jgi:capsular exopolysaccharide synthesis family protein
MTSQNLQTFNQKLADVRARRIEVEASRKLILAARDNIAEQESLPQIRDNPVVQQLRVAYVELLREKAKFGATYGDRHPKIEEIKSQLQSLERDYRAEISSVLKSVDNQYKALVDQEAALKREMDDQKKQAIEISKLSIDYRPLARKAENDEKLYQLVLQRQKETGLTGLLRTNNVRILDSAKPNANPVRPRTTFNVLVAAVLGLLLGVAATIVIEALDNTVKTQEQVEAILGVPVLGVVPVIGENADRKLSPSELRERDIGVFQDPKGQVAESCRSIRTNLLFLSPDKPLASLVVTSPGPQEGKTTTAVNLAITMAMAGTRVLLIDTDLRRPRIHRSFAIQNDVGISNVIVGDMPLEKAIRTTEVPNLEVLPCGPTPPNPAELLHTTRFRHLLAEAGSRYALVILDSPPISVVTDPAIIANLTDGAILVVRGGRTTREAVAFSRRQLADAKARILGSIINRVDLSARGYYYHYYYPRYYKGYSNYGTSESSST